MAEEAEAERCRLQEELARQQAEAQKELAATQVREWGEPSLLDHPVC